MRKLKSILSFILLIGVAVLLYKFNLDMKKQQTHEAISQYQDSAQYEEVKAKVDDNAIIRKAMKAVGTLTVIEGHEQYRQTLEDETWYSYRGISINWQYRFSIAMNLEDIDVNVVDGIANISVNNKKFFIWHIEKTKDSESHSEASWLAKKYSSQEIEVLEKAVLEKVEEKILGTPEYWEQARKSLEVSLIKLCNDLGYYHINFKESE